MWHPDDAALAASSPSVAFAAARWEELFDPYVPDTFQVTLTNSEVVLREIVDLASTLEGSYLTKALHTSLPELQHHLRAESAILALPSICFRRRVVRCRSGASTGSIRSRPRSPNSRRRDTPMWPAKALLAGAGPNQLLLYRIHSEWKDLTDPSALRKRLAASHDRVERHVNRIYTVRNLVAHYGQLPRSTEHLVANLHYYVSLVIARVLHDIVEHPDWSLTECIANIELSYDHLLRSLAERPAEVLVEHMVAEATLYQNRRLWPSSSR